MSPAEWAGIAGAVLAVGALAERAISRLSSPTPRETALPPAPPPSQAGRDAELEALEQRIEALELRETAAALRAQEHREKVIAKLAAIGERLKLRKERDDDRDRGSDG